MLGGAVEALAGAGSDKQEGPLEVLGFVGSEVLGDD